MKAMANRLMAMALLALGNGTALAEQDTMRTEAPALKTAGWERVGEAGTSGLAAPPARLQGPGEEGMRARKAEMVRRLFWIVVAHR